ncbi:MAG TPA: CRTAC1 family protein [Candidatus Limnocylindria bacterium]|nr:CRTAC1 family protein [Candidatus Limnocylindria bacterium]
MKNSDQRPEDQDELVQPDDAAVGRGFRNSAFVLAVFVTLGTSLFLMFRPKPVAPKIQVTKLAAPVTADRPVAQAPVAKFTDITVSSGVAFRQENGAYGDRLLPETMGGGVAFLDFDGDGASDLLFINSTQWPGRLAPGGRAATAALYHNDGHGNFTDVTVGSGLDVPLYGMGVATGDYDNDGRPDVLITMVGGARLFHNEGGGRFTDMTAMAGVGGDAKDWSTAAVFFDLDNDGDLDLYVANYIRWSPEIDAQVGYKIDGTHRAYGPPMNFQGAFPHLYRNDGHGKFTEISAAAGVQVKNPSTGVPIAKTLGVAVMDIDGDGWLDLAVANDTVQNLMFRNRHDGTFEEIGALSGFAFDSYGNTRGAMGIDACRFTKDGKIGFAIGNFANEMTALCVAQSTPGGNGHPLFADESLSWGIGGPSRDPLKFGIFFFDYDLDGRADLLSVNGHLEEEISKIQHGQKYQQPAQLFWNAGDAGFAVVGAEHAGADLFQPIVGRGSATADIDGDGDLDVVFTQVAGLPLLLRNDQALGNHFVRLKLVGTVSNRDGLGASVKLTVNGQSQWREVATAKSYLSASELPVTFGLGKADKVDAIEITWPGGAKQTLASVPLDRLTVIEQPR